jgi:thiol-disulfide isomerase/thioredoxin
LRTCPWLRFVALLPSLLVLGCENTEPPLTAPASNARPPVARKTEVIVFTAKWCHVCRKIPALFERLRAEFPDTTFQELDVDEGEIGKLAGEYKATALPYFLFLADGEIVERLRGLPEAEDSMIDLIQSLWPRRPNRN